MRVAVVVAAAVGWAFVPSALGDDQPTLRPGDWVRGSLAEGERKTISFAGIAGETLDLRAAAQRGSRLVPRLTLLDPAGAVAPAGDANPDAGRVARVEAFVLPSSGVWRIVLDSPTPGEFTLSTRAEPPARLEWTGSAPLAHWNFDGAPGADASIVLEADGRASLELYGPTGERLARAEARRGRAVISHARLPAFGEYLVRVEAAAGEFSARAVVRRGAPHRRRLRNVESPPDVRAFAPSTAPNQSLFTLGLDGAGFSNRQTVAIVKDGETIATASVLTGAAPGATALLDLADVPPGTYSLEIRRHGRPVTSVTDAFAVTNLPPEIAAADAGDVPNTGAFPVEITGTGFDADAQVFVRPAAGGEPLPATIVERHGHESIEISVAPPAYFTGRCDLEVRDADGGSAVWPDAFDVLGYRAAPAAVVTVEAATPTLALLDAAYDASRGRALAAFRRGPGAVSFVLLDAASLAPLDTIDVDVADLGGGKFDEVQAAYDEVGDTYALCLTTAASPARAFVRIVSASDVRATLAEQDVAAATAETVSRVHAAPDRDTGGYLVVWDEFEAQYGSRVWARTVSAAGAFAPGEPALVVWDAIGDVGYPTAAYQKDGVFAVAWAGTSEDRLAYAIRLAITDTEGTILPGTPLRTVATSRNWNAAARPSLTANPADGATLLTWWYGDGAIFRPGARGIAPGTGAPLVTALLDEDLDFDGGVPGGAVWNAERGEFVVTTVGYDSRVAVWRLAENGTLKHAVRVELYEGSNGIPYGGASPGSLGLLRVDDGVDDLSFDRKTTTLRALAGPIR